MSISQGLGAASALLGFGSNVCCLVCAAGLMESPVSGLLQKQTPSSALELQAEVFEDQSSRLLMCSAVDRRRDSLV